MTEQYESRWSLNHTGNRVLLAVVVGLIVGWLASSVGATGAAHLLVFLLVAAVTYGLATLATRR